MVKDQMLFHLELEQGKNFLQHHFKPHHIKVLVNVIQQEKETKSIWIGKEEIKLSLFSGNMSAYVKNSKESTKKLIKLRNLAVTVHKINILKSTVFLYTSNENFK